MIRLAVPEDAPEIARLGKTFFEQAEWDDVLSYDEKDCAASIGQMIGGDNFVCVVAGSPIVGMASGVFGPCYFNASVTIGEELFWWVSDDAPQMTGLRLLDALETEIKARGCRAFTMKSLARLGGERMGKLYERRGYRASETSYIKGF